MTAPSDREKASQELAAGVQHMRDNMPALMDYAILSAAIARKKYLALVAQGFTKDEAIALCK